MIEPTTPKIEANAEGWPIFELWDKYENITMHFNDLLIRLRTQALAAVAALATIVGVFAKSGADTLASWQLVAFAFAVLGAFWIAIWLLDFLYYNKLLIGAVAAILDLETKSKRQLRIRDIDISTKIEDAVSGRIPSLDCKTAWMLKQGRWYFYSIVFLALQKFLLLRRMRT